MVRKFLRTSTKYYKRLGRKKKQKWRRPRGRHNKIREGIRGKLRKVDVGFRKRKEERGKIKGKILIFIKNLKEIEKINKGDLVIIGRVGKKKRKYIEEIVKKRGGEILNKIKENKQKKNEP